MIIESYKTDMARGKLGRHGKLREKRETERDMARAELNRKQLVRKTLLNPGLTEQNMEEEVWH